jgi:hypothetical protein
MNIPTLDTTVLEALDFFVKTPPPSLDISSYSLPFVVGSGNAINTGKILFSGKAAIFADESNFRATAAAYRPVIEKGLITDAVIISASGEKDSVWELELAKEMKLTTTLLTCKPNSTGAGIADRVYAYKSIAEPYTYNTSTYLGMVLSATGEKAEDIKTFIKGISLPPGFSDYQTYTFVLPDAYLNVGPMVEIKGDELFGPHVMVRAFPQGHARHAKFVHPWEKELVITIGSENKYFGDPAHRWDIPLADNASFGTVIALTYYLCGQIQKIKPDYFMRHIEQFCNDYGPKAYGKPEKFDVIVPANQ